MNRPAGMSPNFLDSVRGGIVVSCQAGEGHPLRASETIALLARCAELGGATGLRINGPSDIEAVRAVVDLPILGLQKTVRSDGRRPLITTTLQACQDLVSAGADAIALEVVSDPERPVEEALDLLREAVASLRVPIVVDISTLDEAAAAVAAGADAVATTLAGHTPASRSVVTPDVALVARLLHLGVPVIAEGFYAHPSEVAEAFHSGAWAVVIGSAITDPISITKKFVTSAARESARPGQPVGE